MASWDEARPYPKAAQLGRGKRRYLRPVASPKRWAAIADEKLAACLICDGDSLIQLHHVVARVHGGGDVADNIVPLCADCHDDVTRRHHAACVTLLAQLTDAEYAYMIQRGGEDYPERAYGLRYQR